MTFSKLRNDEIEPAKMISNTDGTKSICVETYMVNEGANIIGVKVYSEDGQTVNKIIEDGNYIAVALDMLCGTDLPLGTKVSLQIDFSLNK